MTVLLELLPGFVLTLVTTALIVGLAYTPSSQRNTTDYRFTFIVFSSLLYFIIALLRDVQLSLGFGFGLLALFSLLNYRSNNIPVKEVSYLFIFITLPLINTFFVVTRITFFELILVNLFIFLGVYVLEKVWNIPEPPEPPEPPFKRVVYEKIDLIKPEKHAELIADLQTRTGLTVTGVTIKEIDFLRDTAEMLVYYEDVPEAIRDA
jgi:hypothetical protein